MTELINPKVTLLDDPSDEMVIKKTQVIPDDFLDGLAQDRLNSTKPAGNFHKFASIPVAVVEKWQREGFDVLSGNHSAKEIMARLNSEDLGYFISTTKRL
jgi:hypothetical protein